MTKRRIGIELQGHEGERFRIVSRLGNGSFGEVYKTVSVVTGTLAAVKMVPRQKLGDTSTLSVRTVLNEGRLAMLQVNHPNVVRILHVDAGSDPDVGPFVIMEYVDGGNLLELLSERRSASNPFSLDEALSLMRGIALGAQAVNEHLIHRDIKPDNILLDGSEDSPIPRVADFGIAKAVAETTRPETFKGIQAVWYMAPEVWRAEKNTPKIDVYSAGLVFYEVLTLTHPLLPFVPDPWDWVMWREAHLTKPCPDVRTARSDVPLALAKLLLRMTDKSPGNRPGWDEVLSGLSSADGQPKPSNTLDPQLLAAFQNQADARFREESARSESELKRQGEAERDAARREEYDQSIGRLLARFDEIISALNQHETSYPIRIKGDDALSRTYFLPNNRELRCLAFGYLTRPSDTPHGQMLGGGYIGIEGALSANLILSGQPDDIASAHWLGIEANVMALIGGQDRLKWYRVAGLTDETIRFVEHLDGHTWRRDSPTFFGFERSDVFYEHVRHRGMHVYSFRAEPEVTRTFGEILKVGLSMPPRS